MAFKEDLQKLSVQISERKAHITNEEMTKQALIIPFFQVLGFDVFNPLEVRAEFTADFGKKKGERVDYALFKDNEPIIFIEAKSVNENLLNHDAQLSRYFNAVKNVRLGILTNGIEYKFFTDLTADNVMDEMPFLTINILDLKDSDFENLLKFKKDTFDKDTLLKYAEELVYTSALNNSLKELFKNPNDEFIRFVIKDFSDTRITSNVIERFRPLVKKAINKALLDIVSKGIFQEDIAPVASTLTDDVAINEEVTQEVSDDSAENTTKKRAIVTTDDELKAFEIIKNILIKNNRDVSSFNFKDTTNYFSLYNGSVTKWFLRINLDSSIKNVTTKLPVDTVKGLVSDFDVEAAPKSNGESRVIINSLDDIKALENVILAAFDNM